MKSHSEMAEIVDGITYPGFKFNLMTPALGGNPYLQIECDGTDNITGEPMNWTGRKWLLSPHMTSGEIVQTAWAAVQMAIKHEAAEVFKYKDLAIFDPHYDIVKLLELRAQADCLKERS